jgi:hypothetical protein
MFVDPDGPDDEPKTWQDNDYRLTSQSPCINAGSNYVPNLPDADIEGSPRIQGCRVDMGAYESPYLPPVVDDCNENGEEDDCDVYHGTSADCNENHVPDECETDCNGNGVPDDCDLADGTSADCSLNGIPDECDIDDGTSYDDNGNGIPDECDCPGDLDHDWDVDLSDLAALLPQFGTISGATYADGDIDFDGDVDLADLSALLAVYRTSCE